MRVQPSDRNGSTFRLHFADRAGIVDHLPLQVGERNTIVIGNAERANACGRQILQDRRAEPSGAYDKHPRGLQLLLAGAADFRQQYVAMIACDLVRAEGFHGRDAITPARSAGEPAGR